MEEPSGVVAVAPVRVADVGGWTDTWFGAPGRVCHLAVGPGVRVEAALVEGPGAVRLVAPDVDGSDVVAAVDWRARHPLLAHAVDAALAGRPLPPGRSLDLSVRSAVPAGASLGTSASVLVAVLAAIDRLLGGTRAPSETARLAHEVETVRAGREAGVQDQWAAALGGCGVLEIDPYPEVAHRAVDLDAATVAELSQRLVTVVFGAHDSSAVHREVIASLTGRAGTSARSVLDRMAALASDAAGLLGAGDVDGWADVLRRATEAQVELHEGLAGASHRAAIDVCRAAGAVGWKVNGAGGSGGSLTVVSPHGSAATAIAAALRATDPGWRIVDLAPAPGLRVEPR